MDRTQIALYQCCICLKISYAIWAVGKKGVDNFSKKSQSYTCTYTQIRVKSWFLPFE